MADERVCRFCQAPLKSGSIAQEFPEWLESLRTETDETPDERNPLVDQRSILGIDPLDGLQGVIPVETKLPLSKKPAVHLSSLKTSERQQANASLFSQVIRSEGEQGSLPVRQFSKSQNILRWIIAFTLFFTVTLGVIAPAQNLNAPQLVNSPEALAAYQWVEKIAAGSTVLFVVDYQASAAGEMDLVAGVVLQHLAARNVRLVFVSTNPVGAMQAERLMQKMSQTTGIAYKQLENYANLGYIPGGGAGILGFAQNPQQTMPVTADSFILWDQAPFQTIRNISDFALVVVATEETENARSWIEQLEIISSSTPLILAISAQLEPVLMSYYQAIPKQVDGLVTGWSAAAAYNSISYSPGKDQASWTPFSYAGLMAVVLMILAGGYNFLARARLDPGESKPVTKKEEL